MAGGGSQGQGRVEYAPEIMSRWSAQTAYVSDNVAAAGAAYPTYVSGGSYGSDTDLPIDPKQWYGTFGVTSTQALDLYKAVDTKSLFTELTTTSTDAARIATLRAWLDSLWLQLGDAAGTEATKNAMVSAFSTRLATKINTDVIPSIDVGLRNTNAVLSSAIFMAKAAIWDGYTREVSDYSAKVDFEILGKKYAVLDSLIRQEPQFMQVLLQGFDIALKRAQLYLDHARVGMATTLSLNDTWWQGYVKSRVIYVEDQVRRATWYNEMLDYNNKAIASLSGGAVINDKAKLSAAASTISGAMAGAAAGAMAGTAMGSPGMGTAIGAVIGGLGGYLMSQ